MGAERSVVSPRIMPHAHGEAGPMLNVRSFFAFSIWYALVDWGLSYRSLCPLRLSSPCVDDGVIRYDGLGNVIETHEHAGDFREF